MFDKMKVKVKVSKPDEIEIYKDLHGALRWTRRTKTNHKIVGASTEGYNTMRAIMANIKRTQKPPFSLKKRV